VLIDHTQRVDVLRYAQIGQSVTIPGLPSWVPNWDSSEITISALRLLIGLEALHLVLILNSMEQGG
jgi:hypothetical protein